MSENESENEKKSGGDNIDVKKKIRKILGGRKTALSCKISL